MTTQPTELARLLPAWHFRERHERTVAGTPADAYAAFRELRIREMPVSRALFAIRSLPSRLAGRPGLPTGSHAPLLNLMLDAGFTVLADVPGHEIVAGAVARVSRGGSASVAATGSTAASLDDPAASTADANGSPIENAEATFAAYDEAGGLRMAMSFQFIATEGDRTIVRTETRVLATDDAARRRFRLYWLGIRAFSGLIRREWLAAVGRRTAARGPGREPAA